MSADCVEGRSVGSASVGWWVCWKRLGGGRAGAIGHRVMPNAVVRRMGVGASDDGVFHPVCMVFADTWLCSKGAGSYQASQIRYAEKGRGSPQKGFDKASVSGPGPTVMLAFRVGAAVVAGSTVPGLLDGRLDSA